jgi:hypothetical protein
LRGDDVPPGQVDPHVLEVPIELQPWEPRYAVAAYKSDRADFPERDLPDLSWTTLGEPVPRLRDDDAVEALIALVQPWTEQSNGRVECVAVEGTALEAIRTLGPHRVRAAEVDLPIAATAMAWTGASGGAYGRRRGSPVGRMLAWWAIAAVLGIEDISDAADLGEQAQTLHWMLWDPGDRIGGWSFHLAVEDPADGLAWAVSAVDAI